MNKMRRTNHKIRIFLEELGLEQISFFPHSWRQKDIHIRELKADGVCNNGSFVLFFQAKTNKKPLQKELEQRDRVEKRFGIKFRFLSYFDKGKIRGVKIY